MKALLLDKIVYCHHHKPFVHVELDWLYTTVANSKYAIVVLGCNSVQLNATSLVSRWPPDPCAPSTDRLSEADEDDDDDDDDDDDETSLTIHTSGGLSTPINVARGRMSLEPPKIRKVIEVLLSKTRLKPYRGKKELCELSGVRLDHVLVCTLNAHVSLRLMNAVRPPTRYTVTAVDDDDVRGSTGG